ncbi:lysophospholipid acyltransferase family protein [Capnocytophaga catalasegens]|uniref:lysophospholipid acyltransferase family protein n=1 Tax=Capnocytophaga catalasegens TaxID=1004260 RepID=UPI0022303467|nr:lysophospholipid acyltransferase family protein [Capnocytophaga catalasegens]
MKKIFSYPLSILHYIAYASFLIFFHPLQWISIHIFGRKTHRKCVEILNFFLVNFLKITGNGVKFHFKNSIPENVPILFVPNHQSVYDIPPLIWFLRKYDPKFVGKKELDNGTPSIGINLKNNGSVLIDRKNQKESIAKLAEFAKYLSKNKYTGVIFPEGTRSRNGKLKPFKTTGLKIMMKYMPEGYIVPITINNSWKIVHYGTFPIGLCNDVNFITHQPIPISSDSAENLIEKIRNEIAKDLQTEE